MSEARTDKTDKSVCGDGGKFRPALESQSRGKPALTAIATITAMSIMLMTLVMLDSVRLMTLGRAGPIVPSANRGRSATSQAVLPAVNCVAIGVQEKI